MGFYFDGGSDVRPQCRLYFSNVTLVPLPHALFVEEIRKYIGLRAIAAENIIEAGPDGVEDRGVDGYFLDHVIRTSSYTNRSLRQQYEGAFMLRKARCFIYTFAFSFKPTFAVRAATRRLPPRNIEHPPQICA